MALDWLEPGSLRRITRAEFEKMAGIGLFEDERVELLRGVLVRMSPIGERHSEVVDRLAEIFITALAGRARVRVLGAFAAAEDSEPQPDVAIYPPDNYARHHPSQALLVVEVADSSLRQDRGPKAELYAEIGVPEYWIVNLVDDALEVHDLPIRGRFTRSRVFRAEVSVAPTTFPEICIAVASLLP